jgi:hypothetical protein
LTTRFNQFGANCLCHFAFIPQRSEPFKSFGRYLEAAVRKCVKGGMGNALAGSGGKHRRFGCWADSTKATAKVGGDNNRFHR